MTAYYATFGTHMIGGTGGRVLKKHKRVSDMSFGFLTHVSPPSFLPHSVALSGKFSA